jgi:hypothetical protein
MMELAALSREELLERLRANLEVIRQLREDLDRIEQRIGRRAYLRAIAPDRRGVE